MKYFFQYNIRSYPTTILYNNSIPHQFTGHHTAADLVEFIEVSKLSHPRVNKLTVVRSRNGLVQKMSNVLFCTCNVGHFGQFLTDFKQIFRTLC